jgi:predicted ester cyclase
MSDQDKLTMRRFPLEVGNKGKIEVIDEIVSADYVEHSASGYPPTREGLKSFVRDFRSAFPDLRYSVKKEISEGDFVVQHLTASGTMKGDFMGMPAAGKGATWDEVHVVRLAGGKAVEHWGFVDQLGMLQQLGLAPAPPQSKAA